MTMEQRAAQFAPFAALDGHSEAIAATAEATRDEDASVKTNDEE